MKPYYENDGITIYHGDCRDVMEWLDADVLIVDPPYGTQFSAANLKGGYGRRNHAALGPEGFTIDNDGDTAARDEALEMWEWSGDKPVLCFGSPRMAEPPGNWVDRLVWDKTRPGMNGGPWRYRHESIFVSAGFIRVNDSAVSIITAWPDQSDHIHAKPHSLMTKLVAAAPEGVIADPFMGSGSTLKAAHDLNRRAIGVEVEERYCEMAAKRLEQGVFDLAAHGTQL